MINTKYRIISNGLKFKIQQSMGFWKLKIWVDVQKPKENDSLISEGAITYDTMSDAEHALMQLIKHDDADKWRPMPKAMYKELK